MVFIPGGPRAPKAPKMHIRLSAPHLLRKAADTIDQRAAERDVGTERSMAHTVDVFEELTGHVITEANGWIFMACLKLARSRVGAFVTDDYVDAAAYIALAAESASDQVQGDE